MNDRLRDLLREKARDHNTVGKAERLDARRTPGIQGKGPDIDEGENFTSASTTSDYAHREDAFRHSEIGGMWKRSEYLKCRAGMPMKSDRRGLPPGYATGPTWLRAGEIDNDHPKACAQ